VQRVSQAVQQITGAAAEQSAELCQVNAAVTELDQAAQQNAAMVEENAAATAQFSEQARQLEASLARFRFQ
jgi:methyl-accepting chemotaxis protein